MEFHDLTGSSSSAASGPSGDRRPEGVVSAPEFIAIAPATSRIEVELAPHARAIVEWCSTVLEGTPDGVARTPEPADGFDTLEAGPGAAFVRTAIQVIKDSESALLLHRSEPFFAELEGTLRHCAADLRTVEEFVCKRGDIQSSESSATLWLRGIIQTVNRIYERLVEVELTILSCEQQQQKAALKLLSASKLKELMELSKTVNEPKMRSKVQYTPTQNDTTRATHPEVSQALTQGGSQNMIWDDRCSVPNTAGRTAPRECLWKHSSSPSRSVSPAASSLLPLQGRSIIDASGHLISLNSRLSSFSVPEAPIGSMACENHQTITLRYKIEGACLSLRAPRGAKPIQIEFFAEGVSLSEDTGVNSDVPLSKMVAGIYTGVSKERATEVAVVWALEDPQHEALHVVAERVLMSGAPEVLYSGCMAAILEENTSCISSISERARGVLTGMACDGWYYLDDNHVSGLYSAISPELRLSLMSGLRFGKCDELAQYLQVALAQCRIPSVVESGCTYHEATGSYRVPGHAQVRVLDKLPFVLDPTLRVSGMSSWVSNLPEDISELCKTALEMVKENQPASAYAAGVWLRERLLTLGGTMRPQRRLTYEQGISDDFAARAALPPTLPPDILLSVAAARILEYHQLGYWFGDCTIEQGFELSSFLQQWGPKVSTLLDAAWRKGERARLEALPIVQTLRMLTVELSQRSHLLESSIVYFNELCSFANKGIKSILLDDFIKTCNTSYRYVVHRFFSEFTRRIDDSQGCDDLLKIIQFMERGRPWSSTSEKEHSPPYVLSTQLEIPEYGAEPSSLRALARVCLQRGFFDTYPPEMKCPNGVTVRFNMSHGSYHRFVSAALQTAGAGSLIEALAERLAGTGPFTWEIFGDKYEATADTPRLNIWVIELLLMGSRLERAAEIMAKALQTHLERSPGKAWDIVNHREVYVLFEAASDSRVRSTLNKFFPAAYGTNLQLTKVVEHALYYIIPFLGTRLATRQLPLSRPEPTEMAEIVACSFSIFLKSFRSRISRLNCNSFSDSFLLLLGTIAGAPHHWTDHSPAVARVRRIVASLESGEPYKKLGALAWEYKREETVKALRRLQKAIWSSPDWQPALCALPSDIHHRGAQVLHVLSEELLKSNVQSKLSQDLLSTLALDLLELHFTGASKKLDMEGLRARLTQLVERYTHDEYERAWAAVAIDMLIAASDQLGYTTKLQEYGAEVQRELGGQYRRASRTRFVRYVLGMLSSSIVTTSVGYCADKPPQMAKKGAYSGRAGAPTYHGDEATRARSRLYNGSEEDGLMHMNAAADRRAVNWRATARLSSGVLVNTYNTPTNNVASEHHLLIDASAWLILEPGAGSSLIPHGFDTAALRRLSAYIQGLSSSGKQVSASIYVFGSEVASLDFAQTAQWASEHCILSDDWAPGTSTLVGCLKSPIKRQDFNQRRGAWLFQAVSHVAKGVCDTFEVAQILAKAQRSRCTFSLVRRGEPWNQQELGTNDKLLNERLSRTGRFSTVEL